MNVDHYTYRVTWSETDEELVAGIVADMQATGEPVPEPIAEKQYSGKFNVRVPAALHRELALAAAEQGVSLNRLVSDKLARA
ncbi:type II toxin-antitoxin system HicB family antitoxin [Amycolatopsis sp. GM8]|uniref:type II toxin-antitoxin system HicB family antitoxin n=1 Tax=Amycolatopsis sp. GM8 TaxID=2896530 RepID=UPI001F408D7E|nr:type II toxin-antitoxin system HicB family antitoxin [Amycolatopsis sp. GM8]